MSFNLTSLFLKNARGFTLKDSASVTWALNANTNEISAAAVFGGGGLSSVGVDDTSTTPIYTITNSPLVANGTIHFTLSTQTANKVFASPTSGGAAQPTFRAMVIADLPTAIPNANLANTSVTVSAGTGLSGGGAATLGGAAVTLTLVTPVTAANGGTGQSSYAVGDLLYASTATTLSKLADVAAGSYLRSGGLTTAPVWSTVTIPNAAVLGDLWYGSTASVVSSLAGTISATKQFLTQTGNGSISAAPAWGTIAAGDLPANGANPTASLGLAAVNGSATTWMRSDGAPALSQAIVPTWTGLHTFAPASGVAVIALGVATAGQGTAIKLLGSSAAQGRNWLIGNQNNANDTLEFTPSTANGGATFSTAALKCVGSTGNWTFGAGSSGTTVTVPAGTATVTPWALTSGTVNTTAVAGAFEYDGTCFYATPAASSRAVNLTEYICVLNGAFTLVSQTAAQQMFNSTTNGAVTLPIGTYIFECEFSLTALSATSGSFGWTLAGAATFTTGWWCIADKVALVTATSPQMSYNTAANTALTAVSTATAGYAKISGVIRVTVAGTVIPQLSQATAAATVVGINSFFRCRPVGNGTVTTVGNWS